MLKGLQVKEKIGEGSQATVYRAVLGGRTVALKLPRRQAGVPGDEELRRFRREAALLARTSHAGLPRVLGLGQWEGEPGLLLEYVEGEALDCITARGQLAEERIVAIGRILAGALHELHRHGLVHRDIKPQNVVVDQMAGVWLVDFGLLAPVRQPQAGEPFAGTLHYAAPEQTGLLRRALDGRADLYSLGILLYELAVGQLPFQAGSAAEVARLHMVLVPPSVCQRNPLISPALGLIIEKLLAKEPDERYQTGAGLLADLDRLDQLNRVIARGEQPLLGQWDHPIDLLDEVSCIGREQELSALQEIWHRTLQSGDGHLFVIEGEPGSGKSRVVRELLRQVDAGTGLVAKPAEGDPTPFAALREVLAGQLRRWQALPPEERALAEERLWANAPGYGPLLRRVLTASPPHPGEAGERSTGQERSELFLNGLADIFVQMALRNQGLILVVDDLQWADEATVGVLKRLVSRLRGVPLLLVLSVRSDQSGPSIPGRILEGVEPSRIGRLSLEPLSDEAVGHLISVHLGGSRVEPALLHRVLLHTGSNPFVVGEFIRTLLEAGLLWPHLAGWRLESAALDSLELPGGVVALILRRFDGLQPQTVSLLSTAALLGRRFALRDLIDLHLADEGQVYQAAAEGVAARLIVRLDGDVYSFVHDRVREALHAYLPESERRSLHQQIAEMMELEADPEPDRIYAKARHYALGERGRNPERQYAAHLAAGLAAMRDFADEEAYHYLTRAQAIALEFGLPSNGSLQEALGAAAILTGRLPEAQRHLEAAQPYRRLPVNRADIQVQLARVHLWNVDVPAAWRAIDAGFASLGWQMDRPRPWNLIGALLAALGAGLLRTLGLSRTPTSSDEIRRLKVLLHLYEQATEASLFEGTSPIQVMLHMLRSLQYGTKLGLSSELALAVSNSGFLLGNMGAVLRLKSLTRFAERQFRRAEAMARLLRDRHITARVLHLEALASNFQGEVARAEFQHRFYLREHGDWLRTADCLNGLSDLAWSLLMRGQIREGWSWIEVGIRRAEEAGSSTGAMRIHWWPWAYAAPALAAMGHPAQGEPYLARVRGVLAENRSSWEIYLSQRLLFLLERGELGAEMDEVISEFEARDLHPRRPVPHHQRFYIYQGYARWAQWRTASEAERPHRLRHLAHAVQELRRVGPHPILRTHLLTIRSAYAWASGKERAAARLLKRAFALAERLDNPWVQFELLRLQAYMAQGRSGKAQALRYARFALALAEEQGWAGRAAQLRIELGLDQAEIAQPVPLQGPGGVTVRHQRHLSALLQVSLAAAESLDPVTKSRAILREIVQILGAERAFLFLITDGAADLQFVMGVDASGEELKELGGHSRTVVESVAIRRQPMVVHGTEEAARLGSASIVAHDLRSIIAAPLLQRDRLVGVVYVDNRLARGIFSPEDEQILLALATHIAIAMETAKLAQLQVAVEGERRLRMLAESVRNLTQALSASISVEEVVGRFLDGLPDLVPIDHAAVLLLEADGLRVLTRGRPVSESDLVPIDGYPAVVEVVRTGSPVLLANAAGALLPEAERSLIGSWIGLPLFSGGEVIGLATMWRGQPATLGQRELELASTLAGPTAIALARAKLFEEMKRAAVTDELTGIANRRYLMQRGEQEWRLARRQEAPLVVLMLDVDHFKLVNDRYGHLVGDQVLRAVVLRCQRHLRTVDLMGRYGGEEFAILLPGASLEQAVQVAERLRQSVSLDPVATDAGPIPVSISVGVAQLDGAMEELDQLFHQGDLALYMAKEAGRNRVMIAPGIS